MKRIQKIISALLIVMIIAVQLIPIINVKAEGVEFVLSDTVTKKDDPNSKLITNNDVTITIKNVDDTGNFYANKIIDVFYNETTNEVSYQFTEEFQNFLDSNETYKDLTVEEYFAKTSDNPDGTASESVITTSTLNILLSEYLINGTLSNDIEFTISGDNTNGYIATATVETGVYVLSSKHTTNFYGAMVANAVPVVNGSGEWLITNPEIIAKKSEIENGVVEITKKTVSLEKMAVELEANYSINLPTIPTNAPTKSFSIVFLNVPKENIISIRDGDDVLTVDENGKVLKDGVSIGSIDGGSGGCVLGFSDVRNFSSGILNVTFTTEIASEDIDFANGNGLSVYSCWNGDTYGNSESQIYNIATVTLRSYALNIQTQEYGSESTYLNGAEYELYRSYDAETSTLSDKVDGGFYYFDGGASTLVTETGKYYIKQIKAPTGYRLSKDIIEIDVNTGSANEIESGIYAAVVYNEKMWFLPSTGGIGTILYTLVGLVVVGLSTCGIVYYRKKKLNV